jgi:hypothetical protein
VRTNAVGGNFAASTLTTIHVYSMSNLGTAYGGGFIRVCRLLRSTGREQVTMGLKRKELEARWRSANAWSMLRASAKRVEGTGMADEADWRFRGHAGSDYRTEKRRKKTAEKKQPERSAEGPRHSG